MIHWLLQSFDDCPSVLHGEAPAGLLDAAETARLHTLTVDKRRRDWLLGRWTAKRLVQSHLAATTGETVPLSALYIGNDEDGAPFVSCKLPRANSEERGRLPVSLAVSHSHGHAFCALVSHHEPGSPLTARNSHLTALGCDLEWIEPRDPSFASDFFTAEELAAVADSTGFGWSPMPDTDFNRRSARPQDGQATLVTAIWSAKEAVLKAIRTGLTVDTRRVACRLAWSGELSSDWQPFAVELDRSLAAQFPGPWSGWWQVQNDFVLTLALREHGASSAA